MRLVKTGLIILVTFTLFARGAGAQEPPLLTDADVAPWNYAPCQEEGPCEKLHTPPMLGDQLQGGFNFQGGFQGFQGGFNQFGTGFQGFQGFQGGFNLQTGFQGFQAGFQGFQGFQGGVNFQGGFNQFGTGFGGFQGGFPIVVARGAEKMSENDSPRPRDRVLINYNYYNNVRDVIDVHRETIGFEKTFLGGDASVGLRLPFFQDVGSGFNESDPGDLSVRLKYALINTPNAVLSTGIAVTAPTGPIPTVAILRPDGVLEEVHPWQLQPFVGYLWDRGDLYVHGFTSLLVPTDSRDVTVLYNDVGVGYRAYEGCGLLRAVIPTCEVHVNTPLTHRDRSDLPRFVDSVNLTGGSHFLLGQKVSLGLGLSVPVTGPKLFDFEALANINWNF